MAVDAAAIKEKIIRLAEHTFCGSGDVEAQDALTFHQYFLQTYPDGSAERAQLLQDLQGLENRLRGLTGWLPAVEAATVLPFQTDQIQSFVVAPWQLGLAPEDSVKGASKIVYILDTVSNFLASPYRSEREPLDLLFGKGARPSDPIGPWFIPLEWGRVVRAESSWSALCGFNFLMQSLWPSLTACKLCYA